MTFGSVSNAMEANKQLTFLNNLDKFTTVLKRIIEEDPKAFFKIFLDGDLEMTPQIRYMNLVEQEFLEHVPNGTVIWRGDDLSKISLTDLEIIFGDYAIIRGAYIGKTKIEIDHVDESLSGTLVELLNGKLVEINGVSYTLNLSYDDSDDFDDEEELSDLESEAAESESEDELPKTSTDRKVLVLCSLPSNVPLSVMKDVIAKELGKYGPIHSIDFTATARGIRITFKEACDANKAFKNLFGSTITFKTILRKVEYKVRGYLSAVVPKHPRDVSDSSDDSDDSEIDEPVKSTKQVQQRTLTLKNLPRAPSNSTISAKLTERFKKFGPVEKVIVWSKSRMAKVIFVNESSVKKAIDTLLGKTTYINFGKPGLMGYRYKIQFSSDNRCISESDESSEDSDSEEEKPVPRKASSKFGDKRVLVFKDLPQEIPMGSAIATLTRITRKYGAIEKVVPLLKERKAEVIFKDPSDAQDAFEDLDCEDIKFSSDRLIDVKYAATDLELISLNSPKREHEDDSDVEESDDDEQFTELVWHSAPRGTQAGRVLTSIKAMFQPFNPMSVAYRSNATKLGPMDLAITFYNTEDAKKAYVALDGMREPQSGRFINLTKVDADKK